MNDHHNYNITLPKNIEHSQKQLESPLVSESEWILHDGRASIALIQCTRLFQDFLDDDLIKSNTKFILGSIHIEKKLVEVPSKNWKKVKTRAAIEYQKLTT
jgi:hypothetical protein